MSNKKVILKSMFKSILAQGEGLKEFQDFCKMKNFEYKSLKPISKNKFIYITSVGLDSFITEFAEAYGYTIKQISEEETSLKYDAETILNKYFK